MLKVIKAHKIARQFPASYAEERASVDFRAFYAVAAVHIQRVRNPKIKDVMSEVLSELQNSLLNTSKV
jgi:hypothetical protein